MERSSKETVCGDAVAGGHEDARKERELAGSSSTAALMEEFRATAYRNIARRKAEEAKEDDLEAEEDETDTEKEEDVDGSDEAGASATASISKEELLRRIWPTKLTGKAAETWSRVLKKLEEPVFPGPGLDGHFWRSSVALEQYRRRKYVGDGRWVETEDGTNEEEISELSAGPSSGTLSAEDVKREWESRSIVYRKLYNRRDFPQGHTRRMVFENEVCGARDGDGICGRRHPTAHHDACMDLWETFLALGDGQSTCTQCRRKGHSVEQCGKADFFAHPDNGQVPAELKSLIKPWPPSLLWRPICLYFISPHEYSRGVQYPALPEEFKDGLIAGRHGTIFGLSYEGHRRALQEAVNFTRMLLRKPHLTRNIVREDPSRLQLRDKDRVGRRRSLTSMLRLRVQTQNTAWSTQAAQNDGRVVAIAPSPGGVPAHGYTLGSREWFEQAFVDFMDPKLAAADKARIFRHKILYDLDLKRSGAKGRSEECAKHARSAFDIYADYMAWCDGREFRPSEAWLTAKAANGIVFGSR